MNCIPCELKRAKLKTAALLIVGWKPERIALHLSECYGERYYIKQARLYRASKLPPYKPHLIKDFLK